MTAVFCLSSVAAVLFGCWWEHRYERRFEVDARRDLAPVPVDAVDHGIAAVFADDVIAEVNDRFFLAAEGIDYTRTAGGLR